MDLTEEETRKQRIDILLREQGWSVSDRSQVIAEVDTKQSDFVSHRYKTVDETLRNDSESKYVDYLLLDSRGAPLAVIEAKRTSKDARVGERQAEGYADDVKSKTGKDVFIYLCNGTDIWFWDRERYPKRKVFGFHSRKDLERFRFQIEHQSDHLNEIDTSIVDRPRSIENVKRVLEHLDRGHRKALIVMATGTGKTRVSMAIIDALMKQNRVQKVLFLTDRIALRNQAWDKGYMEFFPEESKTKVTGGHFEREKRLFVSTIQTFQEIYTQKDSRGRYLVSPGEFDLIISDEAHRSIYNKWKDVFRYLDAIQIGLTATPAELIDRDTFQFFDCHNNVPTACYWYYDAVDDGVLCDFCEHIIGAQTRFQIQGVKPQDLSPEERQRLLEKGIDPDEVEFEGTELEKKVAIRGTSEAIVREFMENCLMDESGMLPTKSIFFAITKAHAYRLSEAFDTLYPEYKGRLVKVIVSEDSRASKLIEEFEKESMPRIAISVDMLDTGIDVPEVCNLVFAKPVFSKIKFWQMIGRGTRSNSTCKHQDWLPNGHKDHFMVFDFWKNFDYWQMKPGGEHSGQGQAITVKIFHSRLRQLEHLINRKDSRANSLKEQIVEEVKTLPMDSVSVRERENEIQKVLSPGFWNNDEIDYPIDYLTRNIMPLVKFKPDVDVKRASFELKCENLSLAVLENDQKEVERQKKSIGSMVDALPLSLKVVSNESGYIDEVLSPDYWESISYDDVKHLEDRLGPLMRYMSKERREAIVIDMGDVIGKRTLYDFSNEEPAFIKEFKRLYDDRIRDMVETNSVIQSIKRDEPISERDIIRLEEDLHAAGVEMTDEKAQTMMKRSLVELIRSLVRLYDQKDPKTEIVNAFDEYIAKNNKEYDSEQINFIRTMQTVFLRKGHIEIDDLWEAPFSNFGVQSPMPLFSERDLNDFIGICDTLERDLDSGEA